MYNPLADHIVQHYVWEIGKLAAMGIVGLNLVSTVAVIEFQSKGMDAEEAEKMYRDRFLHEPHGLDKQESRMKKYLRTVDRLAFYGCKPGRFLGYKVFEAYKKTRQGKSSN